MKVGCSGGLALAIVFAVNALLTAEVETPDLAHSMLPGSSHEPHEPQDDEDSPSSRKRRMDGDRDGDVGPSPVRRRVGSREDCPPEPSAARGPALGEADQEQGTPGAGGLGTSYARPGLESQQSFSASENPHKIMRRDPYAQLVEDAEQNQRKIQSVIDELKEKTSSMDNVDEIIRKLSNKQRIQGSCSSYKEGDLPTEPE